jgi:hypothetical protein
MDRIHTCHLSDLIRCVASGSDPKNLRSAAYQSMKWLTEYFNVRAMIASFFERRWKVAEEVAWSYRPSVAPKDNYLARHSAGADAAGTAERVFCLIDRRRFATVLVPNPGLTSRGSICVKTNAPRPIRFRQ